MASPSNSVVTEAMIEAGERVMADYDWLGDDDYREAVQLIYLAMQSANTTGSDELVLTEAREVIFDSLYHLRRDDRAEIYHKRAEAMLAKLDAALSQPLGSQGGE